MLTSWENGQQAHFQQRLIFKVPSDLNFILRFLSPKVRGKILCPYAGCDEPEPPQIRTAIRMQEAKRQQDTQLGCEKSYKTVAKELEEQGNK